MWFLFSLFFVHSLYAALLYVVIIIIIIIISLLKAVNHLANSGGLQ